MALFFDGFDQFSRTDRPEQLIRLAGYTSEGALSLVTGRKNGSYAVSCFRGSMSRQWTFGGAVMSFGFAVKFDQRGPIMAVRVNTDNLLVLQADPTTGLLTFGGEVGYANPLTKRWYYIECELDRSNSVARLYINGKLDMTAPLPAAVAGAVLVRLNPYEAATETDYGTRDFDDLFISDSARLNPMQITTRFPTATSEDGWSVAGAASAVDAVTPPIDMLNKFIYTSVNNAKEEFTSNTQLPDSNPIRYLQLITLFRKATSDPMSLEMNVDSQTVTAANISRDWTYRYTTMSPAGYDAANIVDAKFGVRLKL